MQHNFDFYRPNRIFVSAFVSVTTHSWVCSPALIGTKRLQQISEMHQACQAIKWGVNDWQKSSKH